MKAEMPAPTNPRKRALMPSSKLRKALRAAGHHRDPIVQIGKEGVTDAVVAELEAQLLAHELVKVKVGGESPEDRFEAAERIAERSGAQIAQVLGRTVLVYKRHPDKPRFEPAPAGAVERAPEPPRAPEPRRASARRPRPAWGGAARAAAAAAADAGPRGRSRPKGGRAAAAYGRANPRGDARAEPGARGAGRGRPGMAKPRPGAGKPRPAAWKARPASGTARPKTGPSRSGAGRARPGTGKPRPGAARTRPGAGGRRPR